MPDHPALRLSGLLSMDSQPRLPRPWVCGSLELTACTRRSSSSTWFSRREGPSAHFHTHVSDRSRFLADTTGEVFLFLPLLTSPPRQVKDTSLTFLLACYYLVAHHVGISLSSLSSLQRTARKHFNCLQEDLKPQRSKCLRFPIALSVHSIK